MANKNKAKGTSAETRVVNYLLEHGFVARRKVMKGRADEGDVHFESPGSTKVGTIEVKAGRQTQKIHRKQFEDWLKETAKEAAHAGTDGYLIICTFGSSVKDYQVWSVNSRRMLYFDEFVLAFPREVRA